MQDIDLEELRVDGEMYTDDTFVAGTYDVFYWEDFQESDRTTDYLDYEWKRLSSFKDYQCSDMSWEGGCWYDTYYDGDRRDATLEGNTSVPNEDGVNQGSLGDCYFLASAAAVATKTNRLESYWNSDNDDLDNYGFFSLDIYVAG